MCSIFSIYVLMTTLIWPAHLSVINILQKDEKWSLENWRVSALLHYYLHYLCLHYFSLSHTHTHIHRLTLFFTQACFLLSGFYKPAAGDLHRLIINHTAYYSVNMELEPWMWPGQLPLLNSLFIIQGQHLSFKQSKRKKFVVSFFFNYKQVCTS